MHGYLSRHVSGSAEQARAAMTTPVWLGSAVAGLVAGIVMAMFAMVVAALTGDGLWAPPRAITGTFFGEAHAGRSFALGSVATGMMVHLLFSVVFGLAYAAITWLAGWRLSLTGSPLAGMAWGLALWLVNTFLLAPRMPGGELMTKAMPAWAWLVGHLMYGAVVGLLIAAWVQQAKEPATSS